MGRKHNEDIRELREFGTLTNKCNRVLLPPTRVDRSDILIPADIAQQLTDSSSLHDLTIRHVEPLSKVPDNADRLYLFSNFHL